MNDHTNIQHAFSDDRIHLEFIPAKSRYTVVVTQRVEKHKEAAFIEWQREITTAAAQLPGYVRTEIFEPIDERGVDWVVLVHFKDNQSLENWLQSPARAYWTDRCHREFSNYSVTKRGGLEAWFGNLDEADAIPGWRIVLTVILVLYPTVMTITTLLSPHLSPLPLPIVILIGNIISVNMLQWALMPITTRLLSRWLRPLESSGLLITIAGTVGIVLLITMIAAFFVMIGQ
ncbi:Antibiotic biosynthesis monooxygenase [Planctomycetes bacterium Pan216]|uniref:Antibiotic biosynthesis monooxygenase n=1 Tax=Kolteria novifilia TaxID=2527975 RepID=A0A518BAR6_9BACT|nr:Antibiotic biosynthesis monooxygenase [Planctomycetes bacterium Pan216]